MYAPTLIGLCGYARVGKDTVGQALVDLGYERRAFADKLRELAWELDPDLGALVAEHGYEYAKEVEPDLRAFLVRLGAGARKVLGGDVWLDALLPLGHPVIEPKIVVTDLRYLNEVERVLDLGGSVWMIERPGVGPANDEEARSFQEIVDADLNRRTLRFVNNVDLDQISARVQTLLSAIS